MPPAPMLSKKFLREGETAASATSGIIMEAVKAAAVNPVTAFSLSEALTTNFLAVFDATTADAALEGLTGNGLKAAPEAGNLFWVAEVNGMAAITAKVDAICYSSLSFLTSEMLASSNQHQAPKTLQFFLSILLLTNRHNQFHYH